MGEMLIMTLVSHLAGVACQLSKAVVRPRLKLLENNFLTPAYSSSFAERLNLSCLICSLISYNTVGKDAEHSLPPLAPG